MTNLRGKIVTGIACAGLAAVLFVAGCSTTVESTPAAAKALESGGTLPPAVTGFFGPDASKLPRARRVAPLWRMSILTRNGAATPRYN